MISRSPIGCFLALQLSLSFSLASQFGFINFTNIEAEFGVPNSGAVSYGNAALYYYRKFFRENETHVPSRITILAPNASADYPLTVTAYQLRNSVDFQVPLRLHSGNYEYTSVSRTLCKSRHATQSAARLNVADNESGKKVNTSEELVVQVLTMDSKPIQFSISADPVTNFNRPLFVPLTVQVSPSTPQFFEFQFPNSTPGTQDYVVVRASSNDIVCAYFAIQHVRCPPFDLDQELQFSYTYATITTQGTIVAPRSEFIRDGGRFHIVFAALADNDKCGNDSIYNIPQVGHTHSYNELFADPGWHNITPAKCLQCKKITFKIEPGLDESQYLMPTLVPLAFYLLFFFICFFIPFLPSYATITAEQLPLLEDESAALQQPGSVASDVPSLARERTESSDSIVLAIDNNRELQPVESNSSLTRRLNSQHFTSYGSNTSIRGSAQSSVTTDRQDLKHLPMPGQLSVTVDALNATEPERLDRRFGNYLNYIVVVAVFYGLPVVQLVLTYQASAKISGNQDLCYYNFACARPLKNFFVAFNNVYSNVGYVLLGVLCLVLTAQRDILYRYRLQSYKSLAKCGLPQYFGLQYTMAVALIMEGVCSACYHVCPNYQNFQFDSAFMYILGGLFILRLYQNRHSDRHVSAHRTFLLLAAVIFASVLGVVFSNLYLAFWIVFAVLACLLVIYLALTVYYMNSVEFSSQFFRQMFTVFERGAATPPELQPAVQTGNGAAAYSPVYSNPDDVHVSTSTAWRCTIRHKQRFFLVLVFVGCNFALLLYGTIMRSTDFDTFLISLFIMNSVLYTSIYFVMKLMSGERPRAHTWIFFFIMIATAFPAAYFFFNSVTNWNVSAAVSRQSNRDCVLFNFYDNHDLWHFLSAITIFCINMLYLTFDDDLCAVPRNRIRVF